MDLRSTQLPIYYYGLLRKQSKDDAEELIVDKLR